MAAGAIFTPTLLQLSGIGNPVALSRLGIPLQVACPGVGFNLQDHPTVGVGYTCKYSFGVVLTCTDKSRRQQ